MVIASKRQKTMQQKTVRRPCCTANREGWVGITHASQRLVWASMSPVHTGGAPSSAEALTGHADPTGPVKKEGHWCSA